MRFRIDQAAFSVTKTEHVATEPVQLSNAMTALECLASTHRPALSSSNLALFARGLPVSWYLFRSGT